MTTDQKDQNAELISEIQTHDELHFIYLFDKVQNAAFNNSVNKGWHTSTIPEASSLDVKSRKLLLIVGEVSETMEALREGNPPSKKIPGFTSEAEELADVVLRCMDYAHKEGIPLADAILAKHEFNRGRAYKHGGKLI